jgi:hypothetical protein
VTYGNVEVWMAMAVGANADAGVGVAVEAELRLEFAIEVDGVDVRKRWCRGCSQLEKLEHTDGGSQELKLRSRSGAW